MTNTFNTFTTSRSDENLGRQPAVPPRRIWRALAVVMTLATVTSSACSGLLGVDAPDVVQPTTLQNPSGADALTAGALSAIYPNFIAHAYNVGVFTDEMTYSSPFNAATADLDFRTLSTTFSEYGPIGMHSVRTEASQAIIARQQYAPTPRSKLGQLFAVRAFAELVLGETSCNGTPLTELSNYQPVWGAPITSDSIMKRAIADFDSALVYSADSARVLNYVRVQLARALADRAQFAEAAAAVAQVPTSYVYNAEATTAVAGQTNTIWNGMNTKVITVSDREGGNGLPFVSSKDPRVPTQSLGIGSDLVTPQFLFAKYSGFSSPIAMASGIEARLIEAEAALQANHNDASPSGSGWLGILNTLRATAITPAMAPLSDPGSYDARVNLLFNERAYWLYATGHRMGDLRRLIRQYGRKQEAIYPIGAYKAGVNYGTDVVFILTNSEQSNPVIHVCSDKNA